jgi:S-DNA-T family DNA segregation ATPase FtsK/SpoIIIE
MDTINQFNKILSSFNIKATCVNAKQFDNYFFFDLKLKPNAKVKDIQKYGDEISLALMTPCKPSVKILHEQGIVRLEFVTLRNKPLQLFDYFTNNGVPEGNLVCLLGQTVDGQKVWMDLAQNPHMIVAGSTGSGKSTMLHNIIANMLNYNNCIMHLVDPKNIEFSEYEKHIKNINVIYSYEETMSTIDSLLSTMESRYTMMRNGHPASEFPYILLMIDEFADLVMQDKDEQFYIKLCRLAQKCRAARISIILSTQRPSVNVINGAIKANFSARIACRVASHVDSKVVLDITGAENLLGKGDAILRDNSRHMERFQVAYTTATEVCNYFGE